MKPLPGSATASVSIAFGDVDGDRIADSQERLDGTDPYDAKNYSFNLNATVSGIFHTTNALSLAAEIDGEMQYGPVAMTSNAWSGTIFLTTTNSGSATLVFRLKILDLSKYQTIGIADE